MSRPIATPAKGAARTGVLGRADRKTKLEGEARIKADHLKQLGPIRNILTALNDSGSGAAEIAHFVDSLEPLRARMTLTFLRRFPDMDPPAIPEQMARLGNRELEAVLLALLEDLTVFSAEQGENS